VRTRPTSSPQGKLVARDRSPTKSPPTWSCASEAFGVCLYRPNSKRIATIGFVVGSLLVGINQGGALASGHMGAIMLVRILLDYCTPTCVSTMGVLAGSRRTQ